MELSQLYSSKIIEIAANPPKLSKVKNPSASSTKTSRVCGSKIKVDIKADKGKIEEYYHEISACALGQTSAAIVAKNIVGASFDELKELRKTMIAMLKENGEAPIGRFSELKYLQSVKDYPPRHVSTLLVFEAVFDCIEQVENE